jgi:FAD/FMN-containing dehydrogenase
MMVGARASTEATELEAELARELEGEVRFDAYTRHLFSTDASMYAIEPIGVAFPRHADDISQAVEMAGRFDVSVLLRGAGTSHCGQTIGRAVILDCSRHLAEILEVDPEARRARVQPGVVQDDLNPATDSCSPPTPPPATERRWAE